MRGIPVLEKYRSIKSNGIIILYTMGSLNTVRSIQRKSLHVDEISSRSSAYIKTSTKIPATWQVLTTTSRGRKFTYTVISLTHSYGKVNRREHCRRFARLDFCISCLQLTTSQSTVLYRYHGIFETVYYRRTFPNTAHPYLNRHLLPVSWLYILRLTLTLRAQIVSKYYEFRK